MTPFSIIDKAMTVEGEIGAEGRLVIRGRVCGALQGDHVVIAREGVVSGRVCAGRVDVAGTLEGDVLTEAHFHLLATGRCSGQVRCRTMQMEAGAVLDATVVCSRHHKDDPVAVEVKA